MEAHILAILCSFLGFVAQNVESANILLMPIDLGYSSRNRNMMFIGEILMKRGHKVNMAMSENFLSDPLVQKVNQSREGINLVTYAMEKGHGISTDNQDFMDNMLAMDTIDIVYKVSFMQIFPLYMQAFLKDETIWSRLESLNLDIVIADETVLAARAVAKYFKIPFILYQNWGIHSMDQNFHWPVIPSFIPVLFKLYRQEMTFMERADNLWQSLQLHWSVYEARKHWYSLCIQYKPKPQPDSLCEFGDTYQHMSFMFHTAIPFIQGPMPAMPNYISIEGFTHKDPKPLADRYKTFVEQSGSAGVIVVSFGSLFRRLPSKYAELFAQGFAKIPQKVIWNYEGPPPKNLHHNTMTADWIPLTDLLAHPKTKLFVTQCGGATMYEAINHKQAVIGIPWSWDHHANCDKLANQLGMGQYLDVNTLTSEQLSNAIIDVLGNPAHKENAIAAEKIYNDRPMKPNDTIVYWVEYAVKHKGAPHLRPHGAYTLNIFQYLLLDIVSCVLFITIVVLVTSVLLLRYVVGKLFSKQQKEKLQ